MEKNMGDTPSANLRFKLLEENIFFNPVKHKNYLSESTYNCTKCLSALYFVNSMVGPRRE